MDNRGVKYGKWNPAKHNWGMLGGETGRKGGRRDSL